ncbi:hypothetical protein QBZ16_001917 [Prototheca wickerhamii]|uniref:Bacterial surface antigen (D15) domain-containing protein n=1 Tax=Prototheca wickerhamii TaxID=3111 RepID=A0AAD9IJL9_PROWI|nr:hypothetical protein QBZ16_001917 [Prototheca wickerhamii]
MADAAEETPTYASEYDFEEAFERLRDARLRPVRLSILGLERTKGDIVRREFARVRDARTLDEVKDAVLEAYENLMALGIFNAVEITVDRDPSAPDAARIVAEFEEKTLLQLRSGTYVQGREGSVEASATVTNPTGHAESITVNAEWGSQSTTLYSLGIARPRPRGAPVTVSARVHQLFTSSQKWSSYTELLRGGTAALASEDGRHTLGAELAWYRLSDPLRQASRAVQNQFGEGVRSSLKYVFRHETFALGAAPFPLQGFGLTSSTEVGAHSLSAVAGRFAKQRLAARWALPLGPSASLSLGAEGGLLLPLSRSHKPTSVLDRFYLGGLGNTALRGFSQRGVGPTDVRRPPTGPGGEPLEAPQGRTRDALGGDLYVSLLGALNVELPWEALRQAGMYGHLFVNGGTCLGLDADWKKEVSQLPSSFRWSLGVGLVWPTRLGKMELNFCRVLRAQEHDHVKTGVQFGFFPPF